MIFIDYSFEKLILEKSSVSKRGFSVGNPFGTSDSAVKPSALAGKLENSFRVLICRDLTSWFEDLQCGKHSNCRFEEVRVFFHLVQVENSDILLEAGRVLIFLAVYCRLWVSLASYFCGD